MIRIFNKKYFKLETLEDSYIEFSNGILILDSKRSNKEPLEIIIKNSKVKIILKALSESTTIMRLNLKIENSKVKIISLIGKKFVLNLKGEVNHSRLLIYNITFVNSPISKCIEIYGKSSKVIVKDKNLLINKKVTLNFKINAKDHSKVNINSVGIRIGNFTVEAIPAIEIEDNTTESSHSFAIISLDKEKIDYMMSRGIPEKDAKKILVYHILTENKYFKKEVLKYLNKIF